MLGIEYLALLNRRRLALEDPRADFAKMRNQSDSVPLKPLDPKKDHPLGNMSPEEVVKNFTPGEIHDINERYIAQNFGERIPSLRTPSGSLPYARSTEYTSFRSPSIRNKLIHLSTRPLTIPTWPPQDTTVKPPSEALCNAQNIPPSLQELQNWLRDHFEDSPPDNIQELDLTQEEGKLDVRRAIVLYNNVKGSDFLSTRERADYCFADRCNNEDLAAESIITVFYGKPWIFWVNLSDRVFQEDLTTGHCIKTEPTALERQIDFYSPTELILDQAGKSRFTLRGGHNHKLENDPKFNAAGIYQIYGYKQDLLKDRAGNTYKEPQDVDQGIIIRELAISPDNKLVATGRCWPVIEDHMLYSLEDTFQNNGGKLAPIYGVMPKV